MGGRMKIYKLSQDENNDYDTYDSAIVVAENEEEAKRTHPNHEYYKYDEDGDEYWIHNGGKKEECGSWCSLEHVKVEYVGEAKEGLKKGVLLSSFNAG